MNSSSLIIKGSVLSTAKWKNTVWLWLNWLTFKPTKWMSWLAKLLAFAVRPINWKSFFSWRGREKTEGYMDVAYILPTSHGTFHLKRYNERWKPKAMSAILLALINKHNALVQLSGKKKNLKKKINCAHKACCSLILRLFYWQIYNIAAITPGTIFQSLANEPVFGRKLSAKPLLGLRRQC